jgi:hypothetical protein
MLSPCVVREVRRLLLEGNYSARRIGMMLGVSRSTVTNIAHGNRPDYKVGEEDLPDLPQGDHRRCPGCGGLARVPCFVCRVRRVIRRRRLFPTADAAGAELWLELHGADRARYELVRARRLAEEARRLPRRIRKAKAEGGRGRAEGGIGEGQDDRIPTANVQALSAER